LAAGSALRLFPQNDNAPVASEQVQTRLAFAVAQNRSESINEPEHRKSFLACDDCAEAGPISTHLIMFVFARKMKVIKLFSRDVRSASSVVCHGEDRHGLSGIRAQFNVDAA
jgi:hypothetical protein